MSTTYTGTAGLQTTIQIPQDLDNADAASVNISSKAEIDNQVTLLQLYGHIMSSTAPIRIESTNLTDILVYPLSNVLVQESGTWKVLTKSSSTTLTGANVEGGGGYVANTWYYIYVYSLVGVPQFQLSAIPPDGFGLFKGGSFSYKYLGSIRTDPMAKVLPFHKYNGVTLYDVILSIGTGTSSTITSLASNLYIPPTARIGKFNALVNTTPGGLSGELRFYPSNSPTNYTPVTYPGNSYQMIYLDMPVDVTQKLWYNVPTFTGSLGISYFCVGYYE